MCFIKCLNQPVNIFIWIQPDGCATPLAPKGHLLISWALIFFRGKMINGEIKWSVAFINKLSRFSVVKANGHGNNVAVGFLTNRFSLCGFKIVLIMFYLACQILGIDFTRWCVLPLYMPFLGRAALVN